MGHRRWFKVHSELWLRGSMRDTTPEMRGIWIDTLALASDGFYGDEGIIKLSTGVGITDSQIARIFNITKAQWADAKKFFISSDMIRVLPDNTLEIVNWKKHQSEYDRQKAYRDKKDEGPDKYFKGEYGQYVRK